MIQVWEKWDCPLKAVICYREGPMKAALTVFYSNLLTKWTKKLWSYAKCFDHFGLEIVLRTVQVTRHVNIDWAEHIILACIERGTAHKGHIFRFPRVAFIWFIVIWLPVWHGIISIITKRYNHMQNVLTISVWKLY
jgi:hypothetical protein